MSVFTGFVVYFLAWWVVLFAVLPLGIRHSETPVSGQMHGAPDKPDVKKIIIITSIVAAVVWLIIFGLEESNLISFREMARHMS